MYGPSQDLPPEGENKSPLQWPTKIRDSKIWRPEHCNVHLRQVHAGFICRTESNIRDLERRGVYVSENARLHMYKLLDGDMSRPWILLQNPTISQNFGSFEDMVNKTATLTLLRSWIQVRSPHLSLDTMPIMDVFPLVDDNRLKSLRSAEEKEIVTSIVFRITMDLIWTYRPSTIISMQCHSKGNTYQSFTAYRGSFRHPVAEAISSSLEKAAQLPRPHACTIREWEVYEHSRNDSERTGCQDEAFMFDVFMSRHPAGIRRYNLRGGRDDSIEHQNRIINLLGDQYSRPHQLSRIADANYGENSIYSCYSRVLIEKEKIRPIRLTGQSPFLDQEDVWKACLSELGQGKSWVPMQHSGSAKSFKDNKKTVHVIEQVAQVHERADTRTVHAGSGKQKHTPEPESETVAAALDAESSQLKTSKDSVETGTSSTMDESLLKTEYMVRPSALQSVPMRFKSEKPELDFVENVIHSPLENIRSVVQQTEHLPGSNQIIDRLRRLDLTVALTPPKSGSDLNAVRNEPDALSRAKSKNDSNDATKADEPKTVAASGEIFASIAAPGSQNTHLSKSGAESVHSLEGIQPQVADLSSILDFSSKVTAALRQHNLPHPKDGARENSAKILADLQYRIDRLRHKGFKRRIPLMSMSIATEPRATAQSVSADNIEEQPTSRKKTTSVTVREIKNVPEAQQSTSSVLSEIAVILPSSDSIEVIADMQNKLAISSIAIESTSAHLQLH